MPESGTPARFSSTGFQKQAVILTIRSTPLYPVPKHSFKHIFFLLGTPWALAKCPSASHLLPQNLLQKEYFWKKKERSRCLIPLFGAAERGWAPAPAWRYCGAVFSAVLSRPPALDFWSWEVDIRQFSPSFEVHGQEQIRHPSYLGYFYISCIGQLLILYFECFTYVCLHNVEVSDT